MRRANAPNVADGEDPDIAGIVPGPQPNPWGDEDEVKEEDAESIARLNGGR